jgi:DNA ligase-1
MSGKIPLTIYLFDVLVEEGEPVMLSQNQARRRKLEHLVKEGSGVKLMPRIIAQDVGDIEDFFEKALKAGAEGIIAKKLEGPYQPGGRDFNWIKYKKSYDKSALADTVDAVVMGYDLGQGKRTGFGIGDFLIGVYEAKTETFLTMAKVGTGLTDEEWRRMKKEVDRVKSEKKPEKYEVNKIMNVDVWAKPKIVVEIQADEITKSPMHSSGYALRFPRLISWREKKPTDATSLQEIVKMFKMQKEGNATKNGDNK